MEYDTPLVKPIAALLFRRESQLERCLPLLEERFSSPVDYRGPARPFDQTDYYEPEMGAGLSRCIVSFTEPAEPAFLPGAKWLARGIEEELTDGGGREVNLDVGYLDLFKLVLASFKERGNKLYLERGVWADMVLIYERGGFQPLPWSFPDFKSGLYGRELRDIREIFKKQLRQPKKQPGGPGR